MTHEESRERREVTAKAWAMGFEAKTIARMVRTTANAMLSTACQNRAEFPYRRDHHDLIVNRRVAS